MEIYLTFGCVLGNAGCFQVTVQGAGGMRGNVESGLIWRLGWAAPIGFDI